MNKDDIEHYVAMLLGAKKREEEEKKSRIAIEEKLAALIPGPESGSKTVTLEDGTKVTVRRGLSYKAELDKIESLFSEGFGFPAPIKTKTTRELDEKGYEWIRANYPQVFDTLSKYVAVSPCKVAVEVKRK